MDLQSTPHFPCSMLDGEMNEIKCDASLWPPFNFCGLIHSLTFSHFLKMLLFVWLYNLQIFYFFIFIFFTWLLVFNKLALAGLCLRNTDEKLQQNWVGLQKLKTSLNSKNVSCVYLKHTVHVWSISFCNWFLFIYSISIFQLIFLK